MGSKGQEVTAWQTFLNASGYNCGAADGEFGANTYAQTKAFQSKNGLDADGIVGEKTLKKADEVSQIKENIEETKHATIDSEILTIKKGDKNENVKTWQSFLNNGGLYCGTPDGVFGAKTETQTIAFQAMCNINSTGIVESNTYAKAKEYGFGTGNIIKFPIQDTVLNSKLSPNAYQLILDYEVGGGKNYYEKYLAKPTIPGGASGVTVGIGYDLGYNTASTIKSDWTAAGLNENIVNKLASCAGIKSAASSTLNRVSGVIIPWSAAEYVFNEKTLNTFISQTNNVFKQASEKLSEDAFGALVSLVFNRGASTQGARRINMLNIQAACKNLDGQKLVDKIYSEIISMIPIWEGQSIYAGMKRRRTAEANLVKSGGYKK